MNNTTTVTVKQIVDRSVNATINGAGLGLVLTRAFQDLRELGLTGANDEGTDVSNAALNVIVEATEAFAKGLLVKPAATKLVNHFGHVGACDDPDGFLCYPSDGACRCGMYRHHVHCVCGGITQVG